MTAQLEGAQLIMTPKRTPVTLKKGIENLIRNEYGRYVVLLNDQMGDIREPNRDFAHLCADLSPLISGNDDARNREIDKLATLSRYIDNAELLKVAYRLQMLVHLHDRVEAIFQTKFNQLMPLVIEPEEREQFSLLLQDAWAADLRVTLMPDTAHKLNPREIIERAERQEAAVDGYLTITADPALQRTAGQRLVEAQKAFNSALCFEVGIGRARGA
jgi:hypothetical protein